MKELLSGASHSSEIEEILSQCTIENGKLVPASSVVDDPVSYDYIADAPYDATSDQEAIIVQGEVISEVDTRGKRVRGVLARAAFIGAITILPIQAADAFTSNRAFFEVNIIEDGIHAAENAAVIGDNIVTTFNGIKSTTDNIIKLANGGR